jgi:Cu/Ag efflux pump CusA
LRPEARNPLSRLTQAIYLPVLRLCLRFRKTTLLLNLIFLVLTLPLALKIGSQFMPPLFEGSCTPPVGKGSPEGVEGQTDIGEEKPQAET